MDDFQLQFTRAASPEGSGVGLFRGHTWCLLLRLVADDQGVGLPIELHIAPAAAFEQLRKQEWSRGRPNERMAQLAVAPALSALSVRGLQTLALGRLTAELRQRLAELGQEGAKVRPRESLVAWAASPERTLHLAATAALYVEAVRQGQQAPVEAVADLLGISRAGAAARLTKARKQGLLAAPSGTRASGQRLTPLANLVLHREARRADG